MVSGGIFLILLGFLIWFHKIKLLEWKWNRDWPIILIMIGIMSIVSFFENKLWKRHKKKSEE